MKNTERRSHGLLIIILKGRKQTIFENSTAEDLPGLMKNPSHRYKSPVNFKSKKYIQQDTLYCKCKHQRMKKNIKDI